MGSLLDAALGIQKPSKKPTSLRSPRSPPPPRHIDKRRAICIARQLKINNIGKVSLRISSTSGSATDSTPLRQEKSRNVTRRLILQQTKGIETARKTKDSAVGKCILEANDYASRKLTVEQDKIDFDFKRKKKQMTQRRREFMNTKNLRSPGSGQGGLSGSNKTHLPSIHAKDIETPTEQPERLRTPRSPGYMRPLSCNRSKSNETAVAETERFLSSPYMRAMLSDEVERLMADISLNNVAETNKPLIEVQESVNNIANESEQDLLDPKTNLRKSAQNILMRTKLRSRLQGNLLETVEEGQDETKEGNDRPNTAAEVISKPGTPRSQDSRASKQMKLLQNLLMPFIAGDSAFIVPPPTKDEADNSLEASVDTQLVPKSADSANHLNEKEENTLNDDQRSKSSRWNKVSTAKKVASREAKSEGENSKSEEGKGGSRLSFFGASSVVLQLGHVKRESRRKARKRGKHMLKYKRSLLDLERYPAYNDDRFTRLESSLIPDSSKSRQLYFDHEADEYYVGSFGPKQELSKVLKSDNPRWNENLAKFDKMVKSQGYSK